MARKQARRRKQTRSRRVQFKVPKIRLARIVAPLVACAVVAGTYTLSSRLLDRPIDSVRISGPFQRVTALHIEAAIGDDLSAGFLGIDLTRVQERIQALPWIDRASVARRWPDQLEIGVTEQTPAAIWGDRGLLNTRGELFVAELKHVPAELPRLHGPEQRVSDVAARYLDVRERLIPLGLDVKRLELDERGAWSMTLTNGIDVRLGRRDVTERTGLFLDVVADVVTGFEGDVDYVDMRYSNGFTIGWNEGADAVDADAAEGEGMLALRGGD